MKSDVSGSVSSAGAHCPARHTKESGSSARTTDSPLCALKLASTLEGWPGASALDPAPSEVLSDDPKSIAAPWPAVARVPEKRERTI